MGKKKAPSKIYLYPLVNVFFQMYSCKSDDDVLATDHYMCGYNGARLKTILIEPKHAEKELNLLIV